MVAIEQDVGVGSALIILGVMGNWNSFHDVVGLSPELIDGLDDGELVVITRALSKVVAEARAAGYDMPRAIDGPGLEQARSLGRPCCVYLLHDERGLFKIGIGLDPVARVKQLSTASGYAIQLDGAWRVGDRVNARTIETTLHEHYAGVRQNGEWFALSGEEAAWLVQAMDAKYAAW